MSIRYGTFAQSETLSITAGTSENYILIMFCGDGDYNAYGSVQNAFTINCANMQVKTLQWNDIPYSMLETATDVVTSLPVKVYGDGETDISLLLKGNTETSGTPSPQNPITIDGVGNKTANLLPTNIAWYLNNNASAMDKSDVSDIRIKTDVFPVSDTNAYLTVGGFNLPNIDGLYLAAIRFYGDDLTTPLTTSGSGNTRAVPTGAKWASLLYGTNSTTFDTSTIKSQMQAAQITAIYGQTLPSSYIPFGYEISILKDSQALTPIYVSQQLMKIGDYADTIAADGTATYNIRKLVITGEEAGWSQDGTSGSNNRYRLYLTNVKNTGTYITDFYNSHFKVQVGYAAYTSVIWYGGSQYVYISVPSSEYPTFADFKTWLQQQYAAGTPVTIYYLRATPTTETVTASTIPTTGGEAVIDVDTTVKPSELDLTYHGWHTHEPLKREDGQWS